MREMGGPCLLVPVIFFLALISKGILSGGEPQRQARFAHPSQQTKPFLKANCGATPGRSKRLFSTSAALLLPRIIRWIHVVDTPRAYTMNLNFGFLASPGEVIGLGLVDYGATGG